MTRLLPNLALALGFAAGAVGLSAGAADEKPAEKKKAEKPPAEKAPDWSNYANAGEVAGTVVSADEDGLTLRLTKIVPGISRSGRPGKPQAGHDDVELKYADGGLVRWKKLPPKLGADGKKGQYTEKELAAFKKPTGVPGYAAERTDLQAGHVVEVHLVRPKSIPASKATADDLAVKYVMILGEAATPPVPDRKKDDPAKKKDKEKEKKEK